MAERGRPRSFERAAALRRAMELFWTKGFDGASVAELTAVMGINSPSLYAAFGSKEALFREAVALYGATEGGRIWSGLTGAPTARDAIAVMLRASAVDFSRPGKPRGCLIVLGALHADGANEAVRRDLAKQRAENIVLLRQRLERGVAEGELPPGLDLQAIATFYATVQHGMSIQARDGASRKALIAIADCAMVAWDGLTDRAGSNRRPRKL